MAYAAADTPSTAAEQRVRKESESPDEIELRDLAKGKRERRLSRMEGWVAGLEGDKETTYKTCGHPAGRCREEAMGKVVEKWRYPDEGKTFVFEGNKLIRTY